MRVTGGDGAVEPVNSIVKAVGILRTVRQPNDFHRRNQVATPKAPKDLTDAFCRRDDAVVEWSMTQISANGSDIVYWNCDHGQSVQTQSRFGRTRDV
jgi:hypothetical protein